MNSSLRHVVLPTGLSRSIQKEFVRQWKQHRRRSLSLLLFLTGAALWGLSASWQSSWREIESHNKRDIEFSLGLLEMRLKEHFTQAQLWSHQHDLQSLVEGQNSSLALESSRMPWSSIEKETFWRRNRYKC